jgi:hypothetical protein
MKMKMKRKQTVTGETGDWRRKEGKGRESKAKRRERTVAQYPFLFYFLCVSLPLVWCLVSGCLGLSDLVGFGSNPH